MSLLSQDFSQKLNNRPGNSNFVDWPKKKYKIIYADPPWLYGKFNNTEGSRLYSYDPKFKITPYDGMKLKDIVALPVESIAEKDSVLCLWITMPMLKEVFDAKLFEAWGFNYKTVLFTWVKLNRNKGGFFTGLGSYTRANAELMLLGTRGKGVKVKNKKISQILATPFTAHSKKPDEARIKIVKLFGDLPRIELFAREKPFAWDAWGNDEKLNLQPLEKYSEEESENVSN